MYIDIIGVRLGQTIIYRLHWGDQVSSAVIMETIWGWIILIAGIHIPRSKAIQTNNHGTYNGQYGQVLERSAC